MKRPHITALFLLWCCFAARAAYAMTFTVELKQFDYTSLFWAAATGFLGGALKTVFTLSSESRVVYLVLKQARKDLIVSFMAGAIAYLLLLAISSKYPDLITKEIRLVAIGGAGWLGGTFINGLGILAKNKFTALAKKVKEESATSDVVPLELRK